MEILHFQSLTKIVILAVLKMAKIEIWTIFDVENWALIAILTILKRPFEDFWTLYFLKISFFSSFFLNLHLIFWYFLNFEKKVNKSETEKEKVVFKKA